MTVTQAAEPVAPLTSEAVDRASAAAFGRGASFEGERCERLASSRIRVVPLVPVGENVSWAISVPGSKRPETPDIADRTREAAEAAPFPTPGSVHEDVFAPSPT